MIYLIKNIEMMKVPVYCEININWNTSDTEIDKIFRSA